MGKGTGREKKEQQFQARLVCSWVVPIQMTLSSQVVLRLSPYDKFIVDSL